MIGEENGDEVLSPIPMNFVDMALAKVKMTKNVERREPPPQPQQPPRNEVQNAETRTPQQTAECNVAAETTYFKDGSGNDYMLKNGKLYVKGWKDVNCKIRMISEKSGKEVSLEGKKIQTYGWKLIESSEKPDGGDSVSDIDEVDSEG